MGSHTVRCIGRNDDMLIYKAMNVYPSAIREVVLDVAGDVLSGTMRIRKETDSPVRTDDPIPLEVERLEGVSGARDTTRLRSAAEEVRSRRRVRAQLEA